MKNVERALIATGVTLVLSATAGSAALMLGNTVASAAQPSSGIRLARLVDTGSSELTNGGPHGADRLSAAATYIGISAADLRTQLIAGKSLADVAVANGKTRDGLIAALVTAEQQSIATFVDQKGVATPNGHGRGGPGRDGGVRGNESATAATFLGTTSADLRTKLQTGLTLAQAATAAGKTPDALIQALVAEAKVKIEQAKTDGRITADQATKQENGLTERMTWLVFGVHTDPIATTTTFLGTTTADLHTKLEGGQTLAQIATSAGKTRDALIQAIVSDANVKIEQAKTDGKLTADQATQLESGLTDRFSTLVDSIEPAGPGPHR